MTGPISAAISVGVVALAGLAVRAGAGEARTWHGHDLGVAAVALAPDGKCVVTGGADDTLRVWDPATGKELRAVPARAEGVMALAVSPDGRRVAVSLSNRIEIPYAVDGFPNEGKSGGKDPPPEGTGLFRPLFDRKKLPPEQQPALYVVLHNVRIEPDAVAAWPPADWKAQAAVQDSPEAAGRLLALWMDRAWRRPVTEAERAPFLKLYRQVRADGGVVRRRPPGRLPVGPDERPVPVPGLPGPPRCRRRPTRDRLAAELHAGRGPAGRRAAKAGRRRQAPRPGRPRRPGRPTPRRPAERRLRPPVRHPVAGTRPADHHRPEPHPEAGLPVRPVPEGLDEGGDGRLRGPARRRQPPGRRAGVQ